MKILERIQKILFSKENKILFAIVIMEKNNTAFSKTYLKGEVSYGAWDIFSKGVGVLNSFLVLSALTIYEYGSFQLLLASYSGLAVFMGIGGGVISNDIVRFEAEGRSGDAKKLFFEISFWKIIIGIVLTVSVFFCAPFLAFKYGAGHISLIQIMSLLFLHDAFLGVAKTLLELRKKFNLLAGRTSISRVAQFFILFGFYLFGHINLQAVVISLVTSMFITLGFLVFPFIESYITWKKVEMSSGGFLWKIMASYGKWGIFQQVAGKITPFFETWAIKLIISTEAVAIYSVAQTIVGTISGFLPTKTLSVLVPMEIKNEEKLRKIYTYGMKYLFIMSVCFGVLAFFGVPVLVSLFFNKYLVSLPYFKVLLLTLPILSIVSISTVFLTAFRRQKFGFFNKILRTSVAIPLYLILLPIFGLWGLVIHNFIIVSVMLVSTYIYMSGMTPRLFVSIRDIFSFGSEDRIFIGGFINDIKRYLRNK
ncbi:MAG TPA: oligosaccharide flippase family protein, partial [Candidatus Paceibacterota bacterium]